jgi:tRNA-2-methylthio-N6-dimethylallyladenosine synthase
LEQGYREVTLLGQNVDSYYYYPAPLNPEREASLNPPEGGTLDPDNANFFTGKKTTCQLSESQPPPAGGMGAITFAMLLEMVAKISPELRVRFSTSHPKDITDDVLHTIAKYENICNNIHLPVQSGSSRILQLMNRTYTREWYMGKVERIREIIPDCGISSDVITGFCTETEEDHQETLSIMERSKYDFSYMFFYSERPGTLAEKRYKDDIPIEVKKRRLQEIVEAQNRLSLESNKKDVGKIFKVLIEGDSKKNEKEWKGRNSQNKVIVFPKKIHELNKGDYVMVKVTDCTQATLLGKIMELADV